MGGFPSGKSVSRWSAAGQYANGRVLPDGADLDDASTSDIVRSVSDALDDLGRTNNTGSLAMAARHVARLWRQLTARGVQFANPTVVTETGRVTGRQPRLCEWCEKFPCVYAVQHVEFSDHMKPRFVCARHLAAVVREGEYSEGDEFYVKRVRFDV